jgi:hypothetical protein
MLQFRIARNAVVHLYSSAQGFGESGTGHIVGNAKPAIADDCHRALVIGAVASLQFVRASDATHKCGHGHHVATNQLCRFAFIEFSCIQQYCTAQAQP